MARRNDFTEMIVRAYGERYALVAEPDRYRTAGQRVRDYLNGLLPVILLMRFKLLAASAVLIMAVASIYYFNQLVNASHAVHRSEAQVDVLMQRRSDLTVNLAVAVLDYSMYERQVFAEVVRLRAMFGQDDVRGIRLDELLSLNRRPGQPGPLPLALGGPSASASLAGLLAVAEQYPDLKLSLTFQSLMAAIVEVEKDLAAERLKYNEDVMAYMEFVRRFPSRIFAMIFGFTDQGYFIADEHAQRFVPIDASTPREERSSE
uniref:Magnetosome protein n=1 Tax=delta proteobacterium ML-1 TaxID=947513 RepID=K7YKW0_9DELT|nr:magnetosome protein [delta proteobacterium ML-1]